MKTTITLIQNKYVSCHSTECSFRLGCANHRSASEHRMHNGFKPNLQVLTPQEAECHTSNESSQERDKDDLPVPINYAELGNGCFVVDPSR